MPRKVCKPEAIVAKPRLVEAIGLIGDAVAQLVPACHCMAAIAHQRGDTVAAQTDSGRGPDRGRGRLPLRHGRPARRSIARAVAPATRPR
jgi:hypothetical protein